MKWLAVIGTCEITDRMRDDIDTRVARAVRDGYGIVTGGSTGADTRAIFATMRRGGKARVYLPTALNRYKDDLRERARQGKCLMRGVEQTIDVLHQLQQKDAAAIIEPEHDDVLSPGAFYARNELILQCADSVAAYYLEGNATASKLPAGTLLTVARARELGRRVELFEYKV